MKKLLLLFLAVAGYVSSANAADDIYLRSNLNATSENGWYTWDNDIAEYKLTFTETNGSNEDVYYIEVDASSIDYDINFRFHIYGWGAQISPYYTGSYSLSLNSDGKSSETYGARYETTDFQSSTYYYTIPHTLLKASHYKIWVYRGNKSVEYQSVTAKYMWINYEIVDMPVTISAEKATFSCDRALDFSGTGINAYMITGASAGVLTPSDAMTLVPANTGLYLEGSNGTVNVPVVTTDAASGVSTTGNMLVAGTGAAVSTEDGGNTNFILTNKTTTNASAPLRFYKANENTVPAGKAYLQIPTGSVGAHESFWFADEATSVNAVKQEKTDGEVYNLAGQRVAQPTKGLYIVNGKKVIIK